MAAQYTVVSQNRTVQVLSQSQVNDVMEVGAVTIPHGVYYQVEVPYPDWLAGYSDFALSGQAAFIEGAFAEPYVVGAASAQDVDPASGLLVNYVDFTLRIASPAGTSGVQQTTARINPSVLPLAIDYNVIFAPYLTALNETAAL